MTHKIAAEYLVGDFKGNTITFLKYIIKGGIMMSVYNDKYLTMKPLITSLII